MNILFNNNNKEFWTKKELKKLKDNTNLKEKIIRIKKKIFNWQ